MSLLVDLGSPLPYGLEALLSLHIPEEQCLDNHGLFEGLSAHLGFQSTLCGLIHKPTLLLMDT